MGADDDCSDTEDTAAERKPDEVDLMVEKQQNANEAMRQKLRADFEEKLFVKSRTAEARKYANELFQNDNLAQAAEAYERLLPLCDAAEKTVVLSNMAAVRIKQWRWRDALVICEAVLERDPMHQKAMYRTAQAHRGLRDPEAALAAIARAREAAAGKSTAELNLLEKHVRADVKRVEDGRAEATAAARRKEARLLEAAEKERRKLAAEARGVAVGIAPAGAEGTRSWTSHLRADLVDRLMDDQARMMIMEEDGWVQVREVPPDALELNARLDRAADGACTLFYDVTATLHCKCTQMRGTWSDPGAMSFDVVVKLSKVDNATSSEDWIAEAEMGDEVFATPRVQKMMNEYVRPRYLPHVKGLLEASIERLKSSALSSIGDPKELN